MSNNISTNFDGFDNLQNTTALKTKILTLTLPTGTSVANTEFYYFGAGLERGSIVTNIIPSLNPAAAGTGDMTVSYVTDTDPETPVTLGVIDTVAVDAGIPEFTPTAASLNVEIASDCAIRVAFAADADLTADTTYRFAIIYKKGH
jgi:hypothetical protein